MAATSLDIAAGSPSGHITGHFQRRRRIRLTRKRSAILFLYAVITCLILSKYIHNDKRSGHGKKSDAHSQDSDEFLVGDLQPKDPKDLVWPGPQEGHCAVRNGGCSSDYFCLLENSQPTSVFCVYKPDVTSWIECSPSEALPSQTIECVLTSKRQNLIVRTSGDAFEVRTRGGPLLELQTPPSGLSRRWKMSVKSSATQQGDGFVDVFLKGATEPITSAMIHVSTEGPKAKIKVEAPAKASCEVENGHCGDSMVCYKESDRDPVCLPRPDKTSWIECLPAIAHADDEIRCTITAKSKDMLIETAPTAFILETIGDAVEGFTLMEGRDSHWTVTGRAKNVGSTEMSLRLSEDSQFVAEAMVLVLAEGQSTAPAAIVTDDDVVEGEKNIEQEQPNKDEGGGGGGGGIVSNLMSKIEAEEKRKFAEERKRERWRKRESDPEEAEEVIRPDPYGCAMGTYGFVNKTGTLFCLEKPDKTSWIDCYPERIRLGQSTVCTVTAKKFNWWMISTASEFNVSIAPPEPGEGGQTLADMVWAEDAHDDVAYNWKVNVTASKSVWGKGRVRLYLSRSKELTAEKTVTILEPLPEAGRPARLPCSEHNGDCGPLMACTAEHLNETVTEDRCYVKADHTSWIECFPRKVRPGTQINCTITAKRQGEEIDGHASQFIVKTRDVGPATEGKHMETLAQPKGPGRQWLLQSMSNESSPGVTKVVLALASEPDVPITEVNVRITDLIEPMDDAPLGTCVTDNGGCTEYFLCTIDPYSSSNASICVLKPDYTSWMYCPGGNFTFGESRECYAYPKRYGKTIVTPVSQLELRVTEDDGKTPSNLITFGHFNGTLEDVFQVNFTSGYTPGVVVLQLVLSSPPPGEDPVINELLVGVSEYVDRSKNKGKDMRESRRAPDAFQDALRAREQAPGWGNGFGVQRRERRYKIY